MNILAGAPTIIKSIIKINKLIKPIQTILVKGFEMRDGSKEDSE